VYFKNPAGLASLFLAVICAWLVYSLPSDFAALQQGRGKKRQLPQTIPVPWRATPSESHALAAPKRQTQAGEHAVILKCSRCGVTFLTGDELKAHRRGFERNAKGESRDVAPHHAAPADYLPRSLWQRAT
jgi:hypothetical protein